MKYTFNNFEITFSHNNNILTFQIENLLNNKFYFKDFTIDTLNKLKFSQQTNLNNIQSSITFFEKIFNKNENYTLNISENNIENDLNNTFFLNLECKCIIDNYFEIFCVFDIEEKIFTLEEKVLRIVEKFGTRISNIENQINSLLPNIQIKKCKDDFINNHKNIIKDSSVKENFVKENSVKEDIIKESSVKEDIIKESFVKENVVKKENKSLINREYIKNNYYDTFYNTTNINNSSNKGEIIGEVIPKKLFIKHYIHMCIKEYENIWNNFVINSDEFIILNMENNDVNFFMSNKGKVFIYGNSNIEFGLLHCLEVNLVCNNESINNIKVLFNKYELNNFIEKVKEI